MIENFSILVPVYNFDIVPLVNQIHKVASKIHSDFEILLIDDCSSKEFKKKNESVKKHDFVTYIELEKNIGRSKIRNLLFEKAKYELCIIMDCDVLLVKENFLELYLEALTNKNVVVGGHVYLPKPPKDKSKYFHWLYGRKIEVVPLKNRLLKPYDSFKTNSFATSKTLFSKIKFDETLSQYGHEDTLFGMQLEEQKIPLIHINSPVLHIGLEDEAVFLEKQERAIENLVKLYKKDEFQGKFQEKIKLIRFYESFKDSILIKIIGKIVGLKFFQKLDVFKLASFNLWKLEVFKNKMK